MGNYPRNVVWIFHSVFSILIKSLPLVIGVLTWYWRNYWRLPWISPSFQIETEVFLMHWGIYFLWPVLLCDIRVILSMRLLLPHGQLGWRPSHWVKTECITAEVRFHDKAFRKLTWDYFHPWLSTLFRKFRGKKGKMAKTALTFDSLSFKIQVPIPKSFYIFYYIASHRQVICLFKFALLQLSCCLDIFSLTTTSLLPQSMCFTKM